MAENKTIFIEPSSWHFLEDRLFDENNEFLNRDGTLLPFVRLREHLKSKGVAVHTADFLRKDLHLNDVNEYWSLGILNQYNQLLNRSNVRLKGFILLEPPLVAPKMYSELPRISHSFEKVYLHNTAGCGYSLGGVNQDALRSYYWPQPYASEIEPYWSNQERFNKLVVIAGHHHSKWRKPEYYSKRIEAVAELSQYHAIDLYGRGWDKLFSKNSLWMPYLRNYLAIKNAYKGPCNSKLEILSKYRFSLCYENMPMEGYVTEKIFDCLYAGTIPVYLGAPDIDRFIPSNAYVDRTQYTNLTDLYRDIASWPVERTEVMREAGKDFLRNKGLEYFNSLIQVFDPQD
jgi:alpha(1,3/1,4) fucosyltransferase